MYCTENSGTKKALRAAVRDGEHVTIYQPGIMRGQEPTSGIVYLEGPHFPKPHTWYAEAKIEDGVVVWVR